MKRKILKWSFSIIGVIVLLFGILIGVVLTPSLLYANKTVFGYYTVYHNKPLEREFKAELDKAILLLEASEIYDSTYKIDICLNDGSKYPTFIQSFHGTAFGIGFYNKVIVMGNINIKDNFTEINGYKYNLMALLAHESIHCFQFNKLGLWQSNPLAKYPDWKWEGYNEYVARKNQANLAKNISAFNEAIRKDKDEWGIQFADSTSVGRDYYSWWMLIQYCKDYKKLSYQQILDDPTNETKLRAEMMEWYREQNNN